MLRPVSEVLLDDDAVRRFRSRYREAFGAPGSDDPLYESVSAGRRQTGMEHWLPFYYETLETLFDYLPGAAVSFDYQAGEARAHRFESIADFYAARHSIAGSMSGRARGTAPLYRPVRPEEMFLDEAEWQRALNGRAVVQLSPFAMPAESPHPDPGEGVTGALDEAFDAGARPARNFAIERADPKVQLFDAVRDYLTGEQNAGRRAAIAAYSEGSADRLATVLREHGQGELRRVADAGALAKLPRQTVGLAILPLEEGFATETLVLLGEQDILGDRLSRTPRRRRNLDDFITEAASLSPGDLVVHAEHGIGRYEALETISVAGAPHDCLKVLYAGDDRLFVPVENIEVLSRYGSEEAGAQLDRLGGVGWQSRKARVKQRIREIAGELIRIAAERQLHPGRCWSRPRAFTRSSPRAFPIPRPRTSCARSRTRSATSPRGSRWIASSAAMSGSARPRWRCARRSSPRLPGGRSRSSCRRRCWRASTTAASASASPGCRSESRNCHGWSHPKTQSRSRPTSPTGK